MALRRPFATGDELLGLCSRHGIRIAELMDVTLFSIGETPVAGGDILRVLVILTIAYLLSRGIRHAIRRFGDSKTTDQQNNCCQYVDCLHGRSSFWW